MRPLTRCPRNLGQLRMSQLSRTQVINEEPSHRVRIGQVDSNRDEAPIAASVLGGGLLPL